MLFTVKKYNKIIWIYHNNDIEYSQAEIHEIHENPYIKTNNNITKLLNDFKRLNIAKKVYFVEVNTSKLIEQLIQINPYIDDKVFQTDPLEWMKREIKPPEKLKRLYFPHKILLDQFENRTSLKIAKKMLKMAVLGSKNFWKWVALRDIGLIYHRKEQFKKAIKYHEMSLDVALKMNDDKKSIAGSYANLGDVYAELEDIKNTNKYYKEAHKIYKPLGDINALIHLYHNVGMLFEERRKFSIARKYYKKCVNLVKNSNDMWKKAMVYGSYANILHLSGNPNKPIYYYRQALNIANKLNILMYVAIYLGGLGMVHLKKKEYDNALDYFHAAIRIHKVKGNKKLLAIIYNNTAGVYWENNDYETAYQYWKKSYKIFKRLGLKNVTSAKRIKGNIKSCKKKLHRDL